MKVDRVYLKILLILAIVLLASHLVWALKPSIYTTSIWFISFISVLAWLIRGSLGFIRLGAYLMLLGGLSNSVVIFANGGFMPVLRREVESKGYIPINDSTKFVWLSDIIFGSTSVGDLIVWSGVLLVFIGSRSLFKVIK